MLPCLAFVVAAVVVHSPVESPKSILAEARKSADRLGAYHVYGEVWNIRST